MHDLLVSFEETLLCRWVFAYIAGLGILRFVCIELNRNPTTVVSIHSMNTRQVTCKLSHELRLGGLQHCSRRYVSAS